MKGKIRLMIKNLCKSLFFLFSFIPLPFSMKLFPTLSSSSSSSHLHPHSHAALLFNRNYFSVYCHWRESFVLMNANWGGYKGYFYSNWDDHIHTWVHTCRLAGRNSWEGNRLVWDLEQRGYFTRKSIKRSLQASSTMSRTNNNWLKTLQQIPPSPTRYRLTIWMCKS